MDPAEVNRHSGFQVHASVLELTGKFLQDPERTAVWPCLSSRLPGDAVLQPVGQAGGRPNPQTSVNNALAQSNACGATAIAELSAIEPSRLLFNALAPNPLPNVGRAVAQFDFLVLAITQETNGLKIDEVNLGQVQNCVRSLILDPLAEFFDTIGAHPAD